MLADGGERRRFPRRSRGHGRVLRVLREAFVPRYLPTSPKRRPTHPDHYPPIAALRGLYGRRIVCASPMSRAWDGGILRDYDGGDVDGFSSVTADG